MDFWKPPDKLVLYYMGLFHLERISGAENLVLHFDNNHILWHKCNSLLEHSFVLLCALRI